MQRYLVQVLGPPEVVDTRSGATVDFPAGKTLALLAYLAVNPSPPLREHLYHLLWADSSRDRGLQSVRQALWLIRHTFGESALGGRDGTALDRELVGSDVALFEQAISEGRIDEADRLWRGAFLDRFAVPGAPAWGEWVEENRLRLEHEFGAALAAAGAGEAARGEGESAVRRYTRAIQVEPFRAEHRLALVDLLLELRHGTDAEQALDAARAALPEPEFAAAFDARDTQLRVLLRDRAFEPVQALSRPELVGRAQEFADLIARWNLARKGQTQRVVLHGRSGVGKTRLAEELAAVVEQDRGRVVVARTTEPESALPWATIATLVRRLLTLPGANGVSAGSDAVLRRLVPSLARQPATEFAHAVPEPAVLADALADLIGAVAYEAPLLLVLDDGQWIDPGSWALLSRLLLQIETEPVLLLVTLRDGEVPAQVERSLARVRRGPHSFELRLTNLTRSETTELLTFVLGSEQAAGAVGNRIFEVTRGNPLFIVETTKMLRNTGALRLSGDRWVFDAARIPEHFPLPSSIEQLLRQRVEKLSPTAERIARILAQRGAPQDIASLQPTGVSRATWADAIAELVDHGVVLRTGEGYVLAHEQIAAVVRAGPFVPRRRWIATAIAAAVLVVAGIAGAIAWRPWQPLYGGGTIYFVDDSMLVLARPPTGLRRAWQITRQKSPVPVNADIRAIRRLVDGSVVLGVTMLPPESDPYAVEIRPGAEPRLVFRSTTDVEMQDISPAGDRFLLGWDNPGTAGYDVAAITVDSARGPPVLVNQLAGLGAGLIWSNDGSMIAQVGVGGRDTLHVLAPGGRRLRSYELDEASRISWCPDGTLIGSAAGAARHVRRVRPPDDTVSHVPADSVLLAGHLLCAPDSRHALVAAAASGLRVLSILDLATGRLSAIPAELQQLQVAAWVPDTVPPVAREVRLEHPVITMPIGAKHRPRARALFTDGSARPGAVELFSSDQRVFTLLPDGDIIALRPGRAQLTARYAGWLEASAEVVVSELSDSALVEQDNFERLDTARWHVIGLPLPTPVVFRGESVLQLNGDGNLMDGLVSKRTYSAQEGLTAELEFRLPRSRRDRQSVLLSLCRTKEISPNEWIIERPDRTAGIKYPKGDLERYSARHVATGGFGSASYVDLGGALPGDAWHHLAVQVTSDGYAEFAVNRRWIAKSLLRDPDPQGEPWRVCIIGSAVDTQLLVRSFGVWRGLRYLPPDST